LGKFSSKNQQRVSEALVCDMIKCPQCGN